MVRKEFYHHERSKARSFKATSLFYNDRLHLQKLYHIQRNRLRSEASSARGTVNQSNQTIINQGRGRDHSRERSFGKKGIESLERKEKMQISQ